jgi:iron(III) transport system permease protein
MNWSLLQNSLLVGALATLLATAGGFVVALALAGTEARWRRALTLGCAAALVVPPFLATNGWIELLGQNGAWRSWLPLNVYSLAGAVVLLALLTWPVTALLALGAFARVTAPQLESDPALRGLALVRWLLWPMARGAVGHGALITFVLALNNFAVPVILQVEVFPEELWLAFTTRLDEAGAWAAAWPLVVAPLIALWLLRHAEVSWPATGEHPAALAMRRHLGPAWRWLAWTVTAGLLFLSVVLPFQRLLTSSRTWAELPSLIRAAPDAIWNSFWFAAVTATLAVAIGLLAGRRWPGVLGWLPLLVPGILLGRGLIAALQPTILYGTAGMVIIAFALRYLPIGWGGVAHAFRGVDRDLTEAARLDGASGWALLCHVHWPQLASQAGAAWYITYVLCLWDVEALVLIVPPGGETLALRVFNLLHYGHHAQVNAMCVLLLVLALAPLAAWILARPLKDD